MHPDDFGPETKSLFGAAALAVLGGAVRAIRTPQCTTRQLFVEFITSMFAGVLSWLIMRGWGLSEYYLVAMVGASGYVAPRVLDLIGQKACGILGQQGGPK